MSDLPAFFQTNCVLPDQYLEPLPHTSMDNPLSEPREATGEEEVPKQLLRLLPSEPKGHTAVKNFVNEQQEGDTWVYSSLYSDKMYKMFPQLFQRFLDEFDTILGNATPFFIRIRDDPDSIVRLLDFDDVKKRLYNLYNRVKVYYYRVNVYGMRCITIDLIELIGCLIDEEVEL
jgi:hypothetical protein